MKKYDVFSVQVYNDPTLFDSQCKEMLNEGYYRVYNLQILINSEGNEVYYQQFEKIIDAPNPEPESKVVIRPFHS